jgi:nitroreductase
MWLVTPAAGRTPQLEAGRAFLRLQLQAAALGLVTQPPSQVLQEYPEIADLYRDLHELIGDGQRLQMLVRVGYAKPVVPAPRRGLEAHMLS